MFTDTTAWEGAFHGLTASRGTRPESRLTGESREDGVKKKGAPRAEVTGCSPDAVWHPGGHSNTCSGGFLPFFSGTAKDGRCLLTWSRCRGVGEALSILACFKTCACLLMMM